MYHVRNVRFDYIEGLQLANTLVDWYGVKDPHPAAVPNLNKLVDYMVNNHYTNNLSVVTPYRLAKELNRQQKQITMLIANRPGFVQVTRNGKSVGYYWDRASLGGTYPRTFAGYRGKPLISVEDLVDVNKEAAIANAKEIGKQMQANLKEHRQELRADKKPDLILEPDLKGERITMTVSFVPMSPGDARVGIERAGNPSGLQAHELMSALLSSAIPLKD